MVDQTISHSTKQQSGAIYNDKSILMSEPGTLRVIKREGHVVPFDSNRINIAIKNAFLATEGSYMKKSESLQNKV